MLKIIGKNSTGKTKQLVCAAVNNGGVIVCRNPERMKEKVYAYGYPGAEIISYKDFISLKERPKNYYVDDVDELLELLNVGAFVLTKDNCYE